MLTATDLVPALVHHLKVSADVLLVSLGRDAGGDDASTAGVDVQQVVVTCRDLGLAVLWQNTQVSSASSRDNVRWNCYIDDMLIDSDLGGSLNLTMCAV